MTKTDCYSERLDDALALAASAFRPIIRKGSGVPYLTHLLQVMVTVGEHGGTEDQMIAAVLHDYLEDIDGSSAEELTERFGATVARYVEALSDTVVRPKPPWKERKDAYLTALRVEPAEIKLISAADKLHNSSSIVRDHHAIGEAIFERFSASKEQTLWYYRAVIAALRDQWTHPIVGTLEDMVRQMHERSGVVYVAEI